jgi:hypothetical protein
LVKVIVDRFTGLLFSERRHPQIRVIGDAETEGTAQALAEAARLWPAMIQARAYGGATGSVCIGFQFVEGRPVVEVHDPRWVTPKFKDRNSLDLIEMDKRYMYPVEERDPQTGAWAQVWYWYRRLVTDNTDVLWKPVLVGEGSEPNWDDPELVDAYVEHNFGFCPARWIQNLPCADDIDGVPDCCGIYDMNETIDALIAQANRGTLANGDPTVLIVSEDDLAEVAKGSDNAIKLTKGSASYMEINGGGLKAARELAQELRGMALEVAQCVLESTAGAARTATEIERAYSSMLSKADIMREQYGERGVKPLLEMMLKAARIVTQPRSVNGKIERGMLIFPDKIEKLEDGKVKRTPRKLGPGGNVTLQWGGYFEPSLQDIQAAVQAASAAKAGGLVDAESASKLVSEHFRVEDVPAMIKRMAEEQGGQADMFAQPGLDALNGGFEAPPEPEQEYAPEPEQEQEAPEQEYAPQEATIPEPPQPTGELKLTPSDLGAIVSVNEARASVGLGPLLNVDGSPNPDGVLTLAEFKAKHEAVVATAASAGKGETAAPPDEPAPVV